MKGIQAAPLEHYFAQHIDGMQPPLQFTMITGGHSNLTYLVEASNGEKAVLRRPPTGAVLATAHDMREIGLANRLGADGVLLSPVFATRSHPGGDVLGPARFRRLAQYSRAPVIALGGMTRDRARALGWPRWAAIDGLS